MLQTTELIDLLERFDHFLTSFAVAVLRQTEDSHPQVDMKLLSFIKGTVLPVPLEIFARHLEKLTDPDLSHQKVAESLWERYYLLKDVCTLISREIHAKIVHRPLLEAMTGDEPFSRAFAMTILASFGHSHADEVLRSAFHHQPRQIRWGILTLLDKQGETQWVPLFLTALEDPEVEVVKLAINAIGRSNSPAGARRLQELLQHDQEGVVIAAIRVLAVMRDISAVGLLTELAAATPNNRIRATIVSAFGELPESSTIPFLKTALSDEEPRMRANAITALRRKLRLLGLDGKDMIDSIKALLSDPDHRVRADAIQCLWELGHVESLKEIERLVTDSDESSRTSGAYLCGKLKLHQLKEHLIMLTKDPFWNVRKTAALALLGLGDAGLVVLQTMLSYGNADQQVVAAYATGLADDPQGVDWLLNTSRSDTELSDMATNLLLRLARPPEETSGSIAKHP